MSEQRGLDRRGFLGAVAGGAACLCLARRAAAQDATAADAIDLPEAGLDPAPARWWKDAGGGRVECQLCPRGCRVPDGGRGACGVRENRGGKYRSLVYARPCAVHLDPIEKKPFFHVLPGQSALSLGAAGCNLRCSFCQNWEISQARPEDVRSVAAPADALVALARKLGAPALACTYSEPSVWAEYVYDIAAAARKAGLRALMVSNGFIAAQPMTDLLGVLGALKVDLKAFNDPFYRDVCGAERKPVLDTLRLAAKQAAWLEIVTLVIPGLNDGDDEVRQLARFVRDELGAEVPLHLTRFHPTYKLANVEKTPVPTLTRMRDAAMAEGLRFVYVGNVPGHDGNHTYCPGCGKVVIRRVDMVVKENRLQAGKCPDCQRVIPGVWV